MREIGSCFNEYAVQISDTSCSNYSNKYSCISPSMNLVPSIQNDVTCLYRALLSTQKQILITVSWCKNSLFQGLNVSFGEDSANPFKLNTNSRLFRKLRGSKSFQLMIQDGTLIRVEIVWDLCDAQYHQSGPEPVEGYYVLIMLDSEVGLALGDLVEEYLVSTKRREAAKFSLISRQEHFSGNTLYSTKAQFCETGVSHDILIRCSGESEGLKYPVLSVCIDKKMVIRVKRLQWNFRGNQTIFLDGLLVDLMWDVHDWFYNSGRPGSSAVFMFRTRSGMENRLWLEEKMVHKDHKDKVEFSLMIYACKSS